MSNHNKELLLPLPKMSQIHQSSGGRVTQLPEETKPIASAAAAAVVKATGETPLTSGRWWRARRLIGGRDLSGGQAPSRSSNNNNQNAIQSQSHRIGNEELQQRRRRRQSQAAALGDRQQAQQTPPTAANVKLPQLNTDHDDETKVEGHQNANHKLAQLPIGIVGRSATVSSVQLTADNPTSELSSSSTTTTREISSQLAAAALNTNAHPAAATEDANEQDTTLNRDHRQKKRQLQQQQSNQPISRDNRRAITQVARRLAEWQDNNDNNNNNQASSPPEQTNPPTRTSNHSNTTTTPRANHHPQRQASPSSLISNLPVTTASTTKTIVSPTAHQTKPPPPPPPPPPTTTTTATTHNTAAASRSSSRPVAADPPLIHTDQLSTSTKLLYIHPPRVKPAAEIYLANRMAHQSRAATKTNPIGQQRQPSPALVVASESQFASRHIEVAEAPTTPTDMQQDGAQLMVARLEVINLEIRPTEVVLTWNLGLFPSSTSAGDDPMDEGDGALASEQNLASISNQTKQLETRRRRRDTFEVTPDLSSSSSRRTWTSPSTIVDDGGGPPSEFGANFGRGRRLDQPPFARTKVDASHSHTNATANDDADDDYADEQEAADLNRQEPDELSDQVAEPVATIQSRPESQPTEQHQRDHRPNNNKRQHGVGVDVDHESLVTDGADSGAGDVPQATSGGRQLAALISGSVEATPTTPPDLLRTGASHEPNVSTSTPTTTTGPSSATRVQPLPASSGPRRKRPPARKQTNAAAAADDGSAEDAADGRRLEASNSSRVAIVASPRAPTTTTRALEVSPFNVGGGGGGQANGATTTTTSNAPANLGATRAQSTPVTPTNGTRLRRPKLSNHQRQQPIQAASSSPPGNEFAPYLRVPPVILNRITAPTNSSSSNSATTTTTSQTTARPATSLTVPYSTKASHKQAALPVVQARNNTTSRPPNSTANLIGDKWRQQQKQPHSSTSSNETQAQNAPPANVTETTASAAELAGTRARSGKSLEAQSVAARELPPAILVTPEPEPELEPEPEQEQEPKPKPNRDAKAQISTTTTTTTTTTVAPPPLSESTTTTSGPRATSSGEIVARQHEPTTTPSEPPPTTNSINGLSLQQTSKLISSQSAHAAASTTKSPPPNTNKKTIESTSTATTTTTTIAPSAFASPVQVALKHQLITGDNWPERRELQTTGGGTNVNANANHNQPASAVSQQQAQSVGSQPRAISASSSSSSSSSNNNNNNNNNNTASGSSLASIINSNEQPQQAPTAQEQQHQQQQQQQSRWLQPISSKWLVRLRRFGSNEIDIVKVVINNLRPQQATQTTLAAGDDGRLLVVTESGAPAGGAMAANKRQKATGLGPNGGSGGGGGGSTWWRSISFKDLEPSSGYELCVESASPDQQIDDKYHILNANHFLKCHDSSDVELQQQQHQQARNAHSSSSPPTGASELDTTNQLTSRVGADDNQSQQRRAPKSARRQSAAKLKSLCREFFTLPAAGGDQLGPKSSAATVPSLQIGQLAKSHHQPPLDTNNGSNNNRGTLHQQHLPATGDTHEQAAAVANATGHLQLPRRPKSLASMANSMGGAANEHDDEGDDSATLRSRMQLLQIDELNPISGLDPQASRFEMSASHPSRANSNQSAPVNRWPLQNGAPLDWSPTTNPSSSSNNNNESTISRAGPRLDYLTLSSSLLPIVGCIFGLVFLATLANILLNLTQFGSINGIGGGVNSTLRRRLERQRRRRQLAGRESPPGAGGVGGASSSPTSFMVRAPAPMFGALGGGGGPTSAASSYNSASTSASGDSKTRIMIVGAKRHQHQQASMAPLTEPYVSSFSTASSSINNSATGLNYLDGAAQTARLASGGGGGGGGGRVSSRPMAPSPRAASAYLLAETARFPLGPSFEGDERHNADMVGLARRNYDQFISSIYNAELTDQLLTNAELHSSNHRSTRQQQQHPVGVSHSSGSDVETATADAADEQHQRSRPTSATAGCATGAAKQPRVRYDKVNPIYNMDGLESYCPRSLVAPTQGVCKSADQQRQMSSFAPTPRPPLSGSSSNNNNCRMQQQQLSEEQQPQTRCQECGAVEQQSDVEADDNGGVDMRPGPPPPPPNKSSAGDMLQSRLDADATPTDPNYQQQQLNYCNCNRHNHSHNHHQQHQHDSGAHEPREFKCCLDKQKQRVQEQQQQLAMVWSKNGSLIPQPYISTAADMEQTTTPPPRVVSSSQTSERDHHEMLALDEHFVCAKPGDSSDSPPAPAMPFGHAIEQQQQQQPSSGDHDNKDDAKHNRAPPSSFLFRSERQLIPMVPKDQDDEAAERGQLTANVGEPPAPVSPIPPPPPPPLTPVNNKPPQYSRSTTLADEGRCEANDNELASDSEAPTKPRQLPRAQMGAAKTQVTVRAAAQVEALQDKATGETATTTTTINKRDFDQRRNELASKLNLTGKPSRNFD